MRVRLRTDVLRTEADKQGDRTRQAIARRIGVTESTIGRLFSGDSEPTITTLLKLHHAYEIPLLHLINDDPEPEQVPA